MLLEMLSLIFSFSYSALLTFEEMILRLDFDHLHIVVTLWCDRGPRGIKQKQIIPDYLAGVKGLSCDENPFSHQTSYLFNNASAKLDVNNNLQDKLCLQLSCFVFCW